MAVLNSTQMTTRKAGGYTDANAGTGGQLVAIHCDITLATQTTSDTIDLVDLPVGFKFLYGVINASATLGSSTVAIGITGATGKYRAAAVFTAAAPTLFGVSTAVDDAPLSAAERPFITIAAANLPASGTLHVTFVGTI